MGAMRASALVFCTHNFIFGTANGATASSLDGYLRPVDAVVVFANGQAILLSEREADGVLQAFSKSSGDKDLWVRTPMLVHFSYTGSLSEEPRAATNPLMRIASRQMQGGPLSYEALASIWIFGGRTTIPPDGRDAVKDLVAGRRISVESIVAARGHQDMLPRSQLERLLV